MAFEIRLQSERLIITFQGVVNGEELMRCAAEMAEWEGRLPRAPDRLTDLSDVEQMNLDFTMMERFRDLRHRTLIKNPIRSAIIAPGDLQFGFARMFQLLSSNPKITVEVFRGAEAAEWWLQRGQVVRPV